MVQPCMIFLLISVMVIDEYGEGIPVAWALSNKEDKIVLIHFLNVLKLKAWRRKLNKPVNNKVIFITIFVFCWKKNLLVSLMFYFNSFLHTFRRRIKNFRHISKMNEYAPHVHEWAYVYRIGTEINTKMYVESFHHVLKIVYLDSKQNRRVDHLLAVLLHFAKDKAFEWIQKLKKKSFHRIKEIIRKRHTSAKEMMSSGIFPIQQSESSWKLHHRQIQTSTSSSIKL